MKNYKIISFATLSIICLFFTSCKKDSAVTALQITVIDNSGNNVSDATVTLYPDSTSLANGLNPISTSTSDANGNVIFNTNLHSFKYFYLAQKGCQNNFRDRVVLYSPLALNTKSSVTTIISSVGTLAFKNTSTYPYTIYVNNVALGTLNGNSNYSFPYALIGNYSIRVLQNSGYIVYPTDETFTGTLNCGSTLTTTFP